MKFCFKNFLITISAASFAILWGACSTATIPQTPEDDEDFAEVTSSSSEKESSSSQKPESSSSAELSVSSSVESIASSSSTEIISSSSEDVVSSSSEEESSSSEHVIPEKATDKNTQSIDNRDKLMEEANDVPAVDEMVKSDSLIFNENDLDFEKNDYYCYDATSDGWYKISGSKWKSFLAGLIDWINKLFTGDRYYDYSKVCDEIYIKAKNKYNEN